MAGVARNIDDALCQMRRFTPDVVLIDLKLSEIYDPNLIPKLRQSCPEILIIITSLLPPEFHSQFMSAYENATREIGASAFLWKSFITTEIFPTVKRIVDNKSEGIKEGRSYKGQEILMRNRKMPLCNEISSLSM